jgi:hypothetical protein
MGLMWHRAFGSVKKLRISDGTQPELRHGTREFDGFFH